MCHTYVPSVGYVCHECKSEFKEYLASEGKTDLCENEIIDEFEKFMSTRKGYSGKGRQMDIDEFFDKHSQ